MPKEKPFLISEYTKFWKVAPYLENGEERYALVEKENLGHPITPCASGLIDSIRRWFNIPKRPKMIWIYWYLKPGEERQEFVYSTDCICNQYVHDRNRKHFYSLWWISGTKDFWKLCGESERVYAEVWYEE